MFILVLNKPDGQPRFLGSGGTALRKPERARRFPSREQAERFREEWAAVYRRIGWPDMDVREVAA